MSSVMNANRKTKKKKSPKGIPSRVRPTSTDSPAVIENTGGSSRMKRSEGARSQEFDEAELRQNDAVKKSYRASDAVETRRSKVRVKPRSTASKQTKSAGLDKKREDSKSKKRRLSPEKQGTENRERRRKVRKVSKSSQQQSAEDVEKDLADEGNTSRSPRDEGSSDSEIGADQNPSQYKSARRKGNTMDIERNEQENDSVLYSRGEEEGEDEYSSDDESEDIPNPLRVITVESDSDDESVHEEENEDNNSDGGADKGDNMSEGDVAHGSRGENVDDDLPEYVVNKEDFLYGNKSNCALSGIDKLEADNDPLADLLRSQEKERDELREARGELASSESFKRVGRRRSIIPGLSMDQYWLAEISRRENDFYFGPGAKLKTKRQETITRWGKKRAEPYKGVQVNEVNNSDVRHCGEIIFGNCAKTGENSDSWEQFRTVVGQFLRPCFAYKRVDIEEAWRPGEFYKVSSDRYLFQAFLQYFDGKGAKSSVMNKAKLLGRFVKGAIQYFHKNKRYRNNDFANEKFMAEMQETLLYLNSMRSTCKKLSDIERARAKEETKKVEAGKFIPESDFADFRIAALKNLGGIMDTVSLEMMKSGKTDSDDRVAVFRTLVTAKPKLCDKWCLNLLGMLLFFGNGQRNQVYRKLKAPFLADLQIALREREENRDKTPLKLELVESASEKVPRNALLPYIMFDRIITKYLLFHVDVVRPVLLEKAEAGNFPRTDFLVLHSRTGTPLSSQSVKNACVTFVNRLNAEIRITPKDLRASFTTYMVRRYIRGALGGHNDGNSFQSLKLEEFKTMMAAVMNTSVRMLDTVYMEASHTSFGDHIAKTLKIGQFDDEYADE